MEKPKLRGGMAVPLLVSAAVTLFVFFSFLFFGSPWGLVKPTSRLIGKLAPNIAFVWNKEEPTSLEAQRGNVVMINFWASWCEPCMEEMPSLAALEHHFKEKGLLLFAFNLEDNPTLVKNKLKGLQLPENVIYQYSQEHLRSYPTTSIPMTFLIDRKGVIRNVYTGPRNWTDINILREIEDVLK